VVHRIPENPGQHGGAPQQGKVPEAPIVDGEPGIDFPKTGTLCPFWDMPCEEARNTCGFWVTLQVQMMHQLAPVVKIANKRACILFSIQSAVFMSQRTRPAFNPGGAAGGNRPPGKGGLAP